MEALFLLLRHLGLQRALTVSAFSKILFRHSRIKIHGDTFSYFDIVASVKDT